MIVIVKGKNITTLYNFKHKFIRYYLCIIINKIKGNGVDILDEEDL